MSQMEEGAFDSDWYLRRHADVAAAVQRGEVPSALHHYRAHGLAEGRQAAGEPPEFVLHIGPHKTGSSHIQARIGANEHVLADQGVSLPGEWKRSSSDHNHTGLIEALGSSESELLDGQVARVVSASRDRILLSAEDLCLLSLKLVERLGEALSRHHVTIVYYLRCWATRLYSVWQEEVRHGYVGSFKCYIAEHLVAPAASEIINPSLCLDRFSSVFGLSSLRIVSYDQILASESDIYEHLTSTILQVDKVMSESESAKTHASPSFMETEIARMLNLSGMHAKVPRLGMTYLDNKGAFSTMEVARLLEAYRTDIEIDTAAEPLPMLEYVTYRKYASVMIGPHPSNPFSPRAVRFRSVASTCLSDPKVRLEASRLARKVIEFRRSISS